MAHFKFLCECGYVSVFLSKPNKFYHCASCDSIRDVEKDFLAGMLKEATDKIDNMSVEEFEQECIKAGYVPVRR